MVAETTVLKLVELIYDAAGDPSRWPVFLESLGCVVRTAPSALWYKDLMSREERVLGYVGADPAFARSYTEYYHTRNIYIIRGKNRMRPGTVCTDELLCPREEAIRSEFWNDWIVPQGLGDALFGVLLSDRIMGIMCLDHGIHDKPFSRQDQQLAQQLMPHLQRAIQLHLRISTLESQQRAAVDALNRWSLGVILVNSKGLVLLMNRSAETLLNQKDGLLLDRRGLRTSRSIENTILRGLIQGAIQVSLGGNGGSPGGAISLSRPSSKRPLSVLVTPACPNSHLFPVADASAVVFVSDPESMAESSAEILARLYSLTPAESAVASLLMQGKSTEEAAETLGISKNAVRFHIKHLFGKTGTRRQGELIRLLLTGPAQIRVA